MSAQVLRVPLAPKFVGEADDGVDVRVYSLSLGGKGPVQVGPIVLGSPGNLEDHVRKDQRVEPVRVHLQKRHIDPQALQDGWDPSTEPAVAQVVDPNIELVSLMGEHRGVPAEHTVLFDDYHPLAHCHQVGCRRQPSQTCPHHHHVGIGTRLIHSGSPLPSRAPEGAMMPDPPSPAAGPGCGTDTAESPPNTTAGSTAAAFPQFLLRHLHGPKGQYRSMTPAAGRPRANRWAICRI